MKVVLPNLVREVDEEVLVSEEVEMAISTEELDEMRQWVKKLGEYLFYCLPQPLDPFKTSSSSLLLKVH